MPRCRVVTPEVVRIPLSDSDDWIEVKRELNAGEYADLLTALIARQSFATILTYVVGWSLIGLDGKPLPWDLDGDVEIRRQTVRGLDKVTVREITAKLDIHQTAEEAALTAKKKTAETGGGS